jgi:hypothetical protein
MNRVHQAVLVFSTVLGSWLGMQDVHELGHVTAAWLTGGRVSHVVVDPLAISRTDLSENPRPLVVVGAVRFSGLRSHSPFGSRPAPRDCPVRSYCDSSPAFV